MANILISYISILQDNKNYNSSGDNQKYVFDDSSDTICGVLTNEAGTKYTMKYLNDHNQKLDKIICLCSEAVLNKEKKITVDSEKHSFNTMEYFKYIIKTKAKEEIGYDGADEIEFKEIKINEFEESLSEIMNEVNDDDNVFIDTTGGLRDAVIYIQLIMKILKYRNVKIEKMIYADIANKQKRIKDISNINVYYSILEGVNQFATSGKADILKHELVKYECPEMKKVIFSMGRFAEALQLCETSNLKDIISELNTDISLMKKVKITDGVVSVFQNMIPVIEKKFRDANESYCTIIEWCLDNGLLQQALTLYIEKIPEYLIQNRILVYKDNKYTDDDMKSGFNSKNEEMVIFYEKFMSLGETQKNPFISEILNALNEYSINEIIKSNYSSQARQLINLLKMIKKNTKNVNFKEWIKRHKEKLQMSNKTDSIEYKLYYISEGKGYKSFESLLNEMSNNATYTDADGIKKSIIKDIFGIEDTEKADTFEKKIFTAENINAEIFNNSDFTLNVSVEEIRKVMFDYIYAKAKRNQINHASDQENLTEEQKEKFTEYAPKNDESKSEAVSRNIKRSINLIKNMKVGN